MDLTTVTSLISSYGFPMVLAAALLWYIYKTTLSAKEERAQTLVTYKSEIKELKDEYNNRINKIESKYDKQIDKLTNSIDNNTEVMNRLLNKLEKGDK